MYSAVLLIHSWLRWVALIAAVLSLAALLQEGRSAAARADRLGLVLLIALDVQMLLGLLMYFALSPFTTEALRDFGAAMRNAQLRFWAVEHVTMMLAAVILVHVGRVLGRKATSVESKRMRLLICVGLAFFAMLGGMPWPGMPNGRPLFRI